MYAVVKSGGSHYRVEVGDVIDVEKLAAAAGEQIELDDVLLLSGEEGVTIGKPTVEGAKVRATVQREVVGPKITVVKFRPKKRYRRKQGHRQHYTRLVIDAIEAS